MVRRLPEKSVRIWSRDTVEGEDLYPLAEAFRLPEARTATWERPLLTGAPSAEGDQFMSTFAQADFSGGFGIEDADEGVNTSNIRFGIIDVRSPHLVQLPPLTETPTKPTGATGSALPLGDVVDPSTKLAQFYMAWGSHAWGYDEVNDVFYTTDNNLTKTPLRAGTQFNGRLYVPCGADGGFILTEATPATGTLTITQIASGTLTPLAFCTHRNRLYAICTDNKMYFQKTTDGSGVWNVVEDQFGTDAVLDLSHTPKQLIVYFDREGLEKLWCITNKGAWIYDEGINEWIQHPMTPSPHPDFGKAAITWRSGEDLWIAAGGLDAVRITAADVEVPMAGPSKEQGVPARYTGTITSFCAERSSLYALVKGLIATNDPTFLEESADAAPSVVVAPVAMWLAVWTGTAWIGLWEDPGANGEPTWLTLSTVANGYRIWWGGTDGVARTQRIPDDFLNPRAKLLLGRYPYARTGWFESVRYDANMIGWDKIASHMFGIMDFADTDYYIDVSYRTDADAYRIVGTDPAAVDPTYQPLARIDTKGRTLIWLDNKEIDPITGEPYREGKEFQWIQYRTDWARGDDIYLSPLMTAISLHHLRVPQDSASFTVRIILGKTWNTSARARWARLKAFQTRRSLCHLQVDNYEFFRGRITSLSNERWGGGENEPLIAVVGFVELEASSNQFTTTAASTETL